jgi:hypothetical protein
LLNSIIHLFGSSKTAITVQHHPCHHQKLLPCSSHLAEWQALLLNPACRTELVSSDLSSQLVYAMGALKLPQQAIDKMDNRR